VLQHKAGTCTVRIDLCFRPLHLAKAKPGMVTRRPPRLAWTDAPCAARPPLPWLLSKTGRGRSSATLHRTSRALLLSILVVFTESETVQLPSSSTISFLYTRPPSPSSIPATLLDLLHLVEHP
jgi:hypothetical protein